ncbi:MAG: hypothetical protein M3R53_06710 [Candidatus Eremiobacteraeota bacterium]|nr:hypothetical protein [Candidatus Eremiobacteraeota bacterium]
MKSTVAIVPIALLLGTFAGSGVSQAGSTSGQRGISAASSHAALPTPDPRIRFPNGFYANVIASVGSPRELAFLPNGDLLVGSLGNALTIVPGADGPGAAGTPQTFITLPESPAHGVTYAPNGAVYAATNTTVWKIPYTSGDRFESTATAIARVRTGPVAPHSDGDVHTTTSVVASATSLYVGVGSSCNACVEVDPTRATVLQMALDGSNVTTLATHTRNPIALALSWTGMLFVGGAGQDSLPYGHPYEYFDSPMTHGPGTIDYGWPDCEENRILYNPLQKSPPPSCSGTVAPAIEFPAYSTLIGAAFYPALVATYAFPKGYSHGVFVTSHGSWHCCPATPPRVYFVPMRGNMRPSIPVNWNDPTAQSRQFVWGWGSTSNTNYLGRPTGVAVGPGGSLFVADDRGLIYRIRHY